MTDFAIFSAADIARLSAPHVARAEFADVQFPSGRRRLHTGFGPVTVGGYTWEGLNDPYGGQLVQLGGMQEPRFGRAPAVDAVFAGTNKTFLKQVWDDDVEGVACDLYWAMFDGETGEVLSDLVLLLKGRLSAPRIAFEGLGVRSIAIRIVGADEGLNFPVPRSDWSPADQRARYPGDKGLDFVGSELIEVYKP